MKCPKCEYLGFESLDRCRNCGYDFSLMPASQRSERAVRPETSGSLFSSTIDEDAPLVALPAAPRAPLAVRRTAERRRPRAAARLVRPPAAPRLETRPPETRPPEPSRPARRAAAGRGTTVTRRPPGGVGRRLAAGMLDVTLLLTIDLVVVALTLRMAALPLSEWRVLPPVPMLAFLTILKLAYFSTFTSVGGQTIGKMAARIRVVADDDAPVAGAQAMRRTGAAVASVLFFGFGFLSAILGADRRAFHDRVARTRVVSVPSA